MSGKYECDQCGACCRKLIIEVTEADLEREPKLRPNLFSVINSGGGYLAISKACPMLCGNQCSVYATRPTVCAEFEAGGEQCQLARELDGLPPLEPVA